MQLIKATSSTSLADGSVYQQNEIHHTVHLSGCLAIILKNDIVKPQFQSL